MIGFAENGLGRGHGITCAEVERPTSKIDTRPLCGCPSNLRHLATCKTANKALVEFLATLPTQMPGPFTIEVNRSDDKNPSTHIVDLELGEETGWFLQPAEARAVARALLLKADEVERANGN